MPGRVLAEIRPLDVIDHFAQRPAQLILQRPAAQYLPAGQGIGELLVEPAADFGQRLQQQHMHGFDETSGGGELVGGPERKFRSTCWSFWMSPGALNTSNRWSTPTRNSGWPPQAWIEPS